MENTHKLAVALAALLAGAGGVVWTVSNGTAPHSYFAVGLFVASLVIMLSVVVEQVKTRRAVDRSLADQTKRLQEADAEEQRKQEAQAAADAARVVKARQYEMTAVEHCRTLMAKNGFTPNFAASFDAMPSMTFVETNDRARRLIFDCISHERTDLRVVATWTYWLSQRFDIRSDAMFAAEAIARIKRAPLEGAESREGRDAAARALVDLVIGAAQRFATQSRMLPATVKAALQSLRRLTIDHDQDAEIVKLLDLPEASGENA